ncbi:MAG TPA: DUF1697 domain-containing protein [Solirubrobacterales bacterium]
MKRYAAFLRGMNLGKRRITNAELREHFEKMGMAEVATFRASGNVVFATDGGEAEAKLARRVEGELDAMLGYDVPVFLRSDAELAAIAAFEPFDASLVAASKGKLQVSLLEEKPSAAARGEVLALASEEDRLAIEGRELYWLPSGGTLESALDQKAIAQALGQATMRTKGTIEQLAARYCG